MRMPLLSLRHLPLQGPVWKKICSLFALSGVVLAGTSCSCCDSGVASGPGQVRYNSWVSCDPDHPETLVSRGKVRMRDPEWKLIPHPRDCDSTVYRTWLHYDEPRLAIDDKVVAGEYRNGRDSSRCPEGQGDITAVYGGPSGSPANSRWGGSGK